MQLLREVQEEVLSRLGRVGIAARHAVESVLAGQHRSIHRGLSVEFAGHRPYQPGDDLRHLDWRVYARTDRFDVRLYEEETRLRATLVVDCSGSMAYGGGAERAKWHYARNLAAALALLMVRQGDAVGLATCDTAVREHIPPRAAMGHLIHLLERLAATETGGETSLAQVLDDLAERLSRRGLVILVTDGFEDPERLGTALRHLRHRRQDLRLFQVVDPHEESFPFRGMARFLGLEGEAPLLVDGDRFRHRYREALAAHRRALAAACHSAGVQLETARTDQDLALFLVEALGRVSGGRRR